MYHILFKYLVGKFKISVLDKSYIPPKCKLKGVLMVMQESIRQCFVGV